MRWVYVFLAVSTALTGVALASLWMLEGDGFGLGLHGVLALVLGIVLTAALAVGLMALMFHSARSGHDDTAAAPPPEERGDERR
ncbi:hypothetical protein [Azospirillum halopraeferens]|uniref:hypothetical protein n=1 Tax=Azospirillum halopraeferens TaxID=34010 RepID=UPI00041344E6|nr:hypothetical protein [Azospirillum halopraeferens]